ncbi:flagellar hook-associated protein 2 [Marinitoga hydrogenitolerans DSM 16785]|uniref:Flagellar hook-associated protein 2 n=1 Tax=Marinitoga hydrogenitolerans (strain DSM 16785 / JCM 12826 / AT1271) TaxID=1122195 RepID=A0A1M4S823_MARH1|nr:flagellar filament capping protein FliD [Marinitoga hydrogenitolerans]SHE28364.1 flagellar hook-associated protein 2 [Marinitoga hydrogenitolerans DSM 16785]
MSENSYLGTFQFGGIASGLDTSSIIDQLMSVERKPLERLQNDFETLQLKQKAWEEVDSKLSDFWDFLATFKLKSNLIPKTVQVSDENVLSATASTSATNTNFKVKVNSLSSSTSLTPNNTLGNIPDLTTQYYQLNGRTTPVAGTFTLKALDSSGNVLETLNINFSGTDTIGDIINQIDTNSTYFTASLNNGKLRIEEKVGQEGTVANILLGDSSDTSNFVEVFNLEGSDYVPGGATAGYIESTVHVGAINTSKLLSDISPDVTSGIIRINGTEITVSSTDTVGDLIARINASNANVIVWYDENEDKLMIRNKEGGPQSITIEDGDSNGNNLTNVLDDLSWVDSGGNYLGTIIPGSAANVEIDLDGDGTADLTKTTWGNTVEYNNVTLNLKSISTGWVDVQVTQDVDATYDKISEFVDKYNEIIGYIYDKLNEDAVKPEKGETLSEEDKIKGVLKGDDNLEDIFNSLRDMAYGVISWSSDVDMAYRSLYEIGINSGDAGGTYENTMKGVLQINEDKLKQAIQNNAEEVWKLFAYEDSNNKGIAIQFKDYIWETTKFGGTIDQISGTTGTIGLEMRDIAKRMTSLIDQLQRKEAYYWQKFSAMEQSVSQMQAQGSWIMSAFAK